MVLPVIRPGERAPCVHVWHGEAWWGRAKGTSTRCLLGESCRARSGERSAARTCPLRTERPAHARTPVAPFQLLEQLMTRPGVCVSAHIGRVLLQRGSGLQPGDPSRCGQTHVNTLSASQTQHPSRKKPGLVMQPHSLSLSLSPFHQVNSDVTRVETTSSVRARSTDTAVTEHARSSCPTPNGLYLGWLTEPSTRAARARPSCAVPAVSKLT